MEKRKQQRVREKATAAQLAHLRASFPAPVANIFAHEYENRQDATFHAAFHGYDDRHIED
jgi:hypothetical protein